MLWGVPIHRLLIVLAALLAALAPTLPATAQETHCPPGQSPQFVHGFADLKAHIGATGLNFTLGQRIVKAHGGRLGRGDP